MKQKVIAALALLTVTSLPIAAQKTVRVRPVVVESELGDVDVPNGRSYLGVGVTDVNSDRVQALKLKDDRGVEVTQVDQDAPAGKAGLKEHDVIVAFNSTPVESAEQFKRLMRETPPGRTVALDIMRDGQPQTLKVQLADRKKLEATVWPRDSQDFAYVMPPMPPMTPMPDFPRAWNDQTIMRIRSTSGLSLESITPQLGDFFGVKNGEGMLVRSVQKGSAAESAGLRAGDVIVRVGDQKITDNSDWREALRNGKNGKIAVVVIRDKKEQTLSMSVPVRKGPDSSALNTDQSPETEIAAEGVPEIIDGIEPLVENGVDLGIAAAGEALSLSQSEVNRAMNQLHRELIANRSEINRNVAASMKLASAELKAHAGDIERAMRDAERAVANAHTDCRSRLQ